jgi:hypothetical protein
VRNRTALPQPIGKLLIALLAAMVTVACGGGGMSQNQGGGANSSQLSLNTSAIDFGSVAVGSSKANQLTLSNGSVLGGGNITVSDIRISGTAFTMQAPPVPLTLTPGQNANISITFSPTSGQGYQGTLTVQVEGVADPATVSLDGRGLAAGELGVSPTTMDFGNVSVGSAQSQPGSLNAGASDITVSSASWNGDGFSVSGITFPVTVPAGQSVPFTVTFEPQTEGSASGSVSFFSDASNSPTTETLTGTGTQAQAHTVSLSWNPSNSNDVVGYNVYRGNKSGGPYNTKLNGAPVSNTSFTDDSVQSGKTYYYVSTAVDTNSQESTYSNQASAVIP